MSKSKEEVTHRRLEIPPSQRSCFFQVKIGCNYTIQISPETKIKLSVEIDTCEVLLTSIGPEGEVTTQNAVLAVTRRGYQRVRGLMGQANTGARGGITEGIPTSIEVGSGNTQHGSDKFLRNRSLAVPDVDLPLNAIKIRYFDEPGPGLELEIINLSQDRTYTFLESDD